MLFASASVASISGLSLPGTSIPIFVAFVALTTLVSARRMLRPHSLLAFVPPLVLFMGIHLAFAFRISTENGLEFTAQAIVVGLFVWAFVARYSVISMRRYLTLTGVGMVGLLFFVMSYHFSAGKFTSYKLLNDPKAVFNLLPLMLLVLHFGETRVSKYLYAVLLPSFITIILLSGERKAYILMALIAPLLIRSRPAATFVALVSAVALAAPIVATFDNTGYILRQLGTLGSFAQAEVESTISNDARAWAISYALRMFEENPLIGVGTNGYSVALAQFHSSAGPHNEWVRVAAENGVVGLLFYAATVLWGFLGLFRQRVGTRSRSSSEKFVGFALFLTLVMYLSFEALDFIVVLAFCLTPMVQFLRFDPVPESVVAYPAQRRRVIPGWRQRSRTLEA